MNDDQFPDPWLLASAYLDGELTAAERAQAEADAGVMATVAELRNLQEAVADDDPPNPTARNRAIRAALADFDQMYAPARAMPVPSRRGVEWGRYLGWAAAAVVIIAIGAVVVTAASGGGNDDDSAEAPAGTSFSYDSQVLADVEPPGAAAPAPADQDTAAEMAPATEASSDQADAGVASGVAEETAPASARVSIPTVSDPDTLIETPEQLTGLGLYLLGQRDSGDLAPTTETRCTYADALARERSIPESTELDVRAESAGRVAVLQEGRYLLDGADTTVLVAVDGATGQTFALDPELCVILVTGPVP